MTYVFRQQLKIHKYHWSWNELYLAWKFCNVQRNAIRERPHIIYKLLVRNCMNNTILIHSDTLCKWNVVIQVKYKACTLKNYVITCTSSFICKIISQFNCYICKLFKFECKKKNLSASGQGRVRIDIYLLHCIQMAFSNFRFNYKRKQQLDCRNGLSLFLNVSNILCILKRSTTIIATIITWLLRSWAPWWWCDEQEGKVST